MPTHSTKLFTSWAAKHKELIALEDRLQAARGAGENVERLALEVEATRAVADRMREAALAAFAEELRERGITS